MRQPTVSTEGTDAIILRITTTINTIERLLESNWEISLSNNLYINLSLLKKDIERIKVREKELMQEIIMLRVVQLIPRGIP